MPSARLPDRELLPGRAGDVRPGECLQTRARADAPKSLPRGSDAMKRFHVHVAVDDLKQSIGFYSALFAAEPSVDQGGLCQVDARRSAGELRHLDPRAAAWPRSSRHPGRDQRRASRDLRPARTGRRHRRRARANERAATPSRKNPGSTIRLEFPGRRFTRQAKAPITATGPASGRRE